MSDPKFVRVARVAWILLAMLVLSILITSLPGYAVTFRGELAHIPTEEQNTITAVMAILSGLASLLSATLSLILATIFFRRRFYEPMVAAISFFLLLYAVIMAGPLEMWSMYWFDNELLPLRLQGLLIAVPSVALLALFPNGRFVPSWTRWLVVLTIPCAVATFFLPSFDLNEISGSESLLISALAIALIGLFGAGVYAQAYRYRRISTPVERQQAKWVVYGFSLWMGYILLSSVPYFYLESLPAGAPIPWWASFSVLGWFLSLNIVPISLGIAVTRYRLWDIDLVINRTLMYSALTSVVIGIYALVVGGLGIFFQTQGNWLVALVATGLVAVLFQPIRERLQRGINRLLYGQRDEPFEVLSRLGQQLEGTMSPERVYPTIVETVAQTLKLPYVALNVKKGDGFDTVESFGKPSSNFSNFPLTYQGEVVGELVAARRAADESFSEADERLLQNIARQAGTAVHALQLAADLQQARQQIVSSREEERRRLRRDLHDGLGPSLAAQLLKIGSARALLADRPEMTDQLLAEMENDIDNTLAEVRRIVYDLRPPALDQWGLAGALRAYAETCENGHFNENIPDFSIQVEAPPMLPELPAAVEVAAYHIGREGLTNVVRHAHARHCTLRVAVENGQSRNLHLTIRDDGQGFAGNVQNGVGLASMRERAEELGGVCTITSAPGEGTVVNARFPLLWEGNE